MKTTSLHLPSNDAATGCLSSVLRRLLCDNLRSTGCCDEECNGVSVALAPKSEQKKPAGPGIVARLMGLESMPVHPFPPPELVRRSRSTSSLDSWPVFITGQRSRGSPQINTSLSFREVPTFLRQENEDFLLLSFTHDDLGETFAMAPKGAKHNRGNNKLKESSKAFTECGAEKRLEERKTKNRNEIWNSHKENKIPEKKCSTGKDSTSRKKKNVNRKFGASPKTDEAAKLMKHRERPERSKSLKKGPIHPRQMLDVECSSDNWSPDSVLDNPFDMDGNHFQGISSPISSEHYKQVQKNPRRNLPQEFQTLHCTSPSSSLSIITSDGRPRSFEEQRTRSRKSKEPLGFKETTDQQMHCSSDVWGQVCQLAEKDCKRTYWVSKGMRQLEETREVGAELGLQILDLLLLEAVAECCNATPSTF